MKRSKPFQLHAPLLPLAVCLMTGISLGGVFDNWLVALGFLSVAIFLACLLSRWPKSQTVAIWLCTVLLGMTLGSRSHREPTTSYRPTAQKTQGARLQMVQRYRQWGVSDEALGVVAAMTLGEKSILNKEQRNTYSKVGAAHILALSGLHLMIIYGVITLFISYRRFRMVSQVLIIIALWAFAYLVGMPPSVVRSAVMISIYALLSLGYRERMSVNTLAFAAIVILIVSPMSLYDIGFQLSFAAVLAILLFNPLFLNIVPQHVLQNHSCFKAFWCMTTVSLSAQLGTAPLIAYYFGQFSTLFLLSNYIVIPLATLILYTAVACLFTCWWTALVHVVASVLSFFTTSMNHLLHAVSLIPYCTIEGLHPTVWQVAFVYVIISCSYILLSLTLPAAD